MTYNEVREAIDKVVKALKEGRYSLDYDEPNKVTESFCRLSPWWRKVKGETQKAPMQMDAFFLLERLISVHAAGNAQAGQNSCQNSYYRLNDKFPSIFFHNLSLSPRPLQGEGAEVLRTLLNS